MNFKLKALAAALAIVAAAPAGAAILDATSGNGELFLSVWDETNQVSYTRDLGIQMSAFTDTNMVSSTDANWTSFLGMVSSPAALKWNVVAGDSVGVAAFARNYLTTSLSSASVLGNTSNSQLSQFGAIDNYIDSVNSFDGTANNAAANVSSINGAANGDAYAGFGYKDSFYGKAPFSNAAAVGDSMSFYAITNPDTIVSHKIKVTEFGNANGPSSWTLNADGSLAYSTAAVSAVPVPAAAWLFGSGLVGLVGVSRRRSMKA